MKSFVQVFFGGMVGTSLRYFISLGVSSITMLFIVNIVGSFILGLLTKFFEKKSTNYKLFFTTGLLGSFTTFSSFSQQWFRLLQNDFLIGISFGIAMFIFCFIAALLGYKSMR